MWHGLTRPCFCAMPANCRSTFNEPMAAPFTPISPLASRRPNRRLRICMAIALLTHLLIFAPSFLHFSCTHDRPLGLPGGSGDKIAKGTPEGALGGTGIEGAAQKKQE